MPSSTSAITVDALGQSEPFIDFQERLSRVAPVDRPVMIVGERGTGKELAAKRLHYLSRRWQAPLVTLNCAALAPSLIESELFGYEKGAFTGAVNRRQGRFESATGGSLFLDEIGNIPLEVQEKILRVVEYGAFERVGGAAEVEVDVRVIGATNADLPRLAEMGRFKRDLLDRLSFEVLFVPPLRERKGDILLLANHFAQRMAYEMGRADMPEFHPSAARILDRHAWPGNVRELKNVVERAVYRSDGGEIADIVLEPFRNPWSPSPAGPPKAAGPPRQPTVGDDRQPPLKTAVRQLEIHRIRQALEAARYNRKKAAGLLGLTYDQFRGLLRKYRGQLTG